jgi:hypothetical protein
MTDQVVDIRKRIEEMRNEVSAAIVSNRDLYEASRALGNHADISMTSSEEATSSPDNDHAVQGATSQTTIGAYKSLESALKMPAFQLNVRNQMSNRLLLTMVAIQIVTNIILIAILWIKVG